MPLVGRLHVTREHRPWIDRARGYKILVDGEVVGAVRDGQTETVEVAPGPHAVQVKIAWVRSPALRVDVPGGGEVQLRCWPNATPSNNLFYALFARKRYFGLVRED